MSLRETNIGRLSAETFDVLVVGGGINGAVSAAALAGKGARVALIDRGDFASVTSQESSNLAWGGIKYLESYELGLVRKLCSARNELLRAYPSTVREIRFFMKHARGQRYAAWILFLGALLYWAIGGFRTRRPRLLSVAQMRREEPVVQLNDANGGIEYSDAYLADNDARFVFDFVRAAMDRGCVAANYVESLGGRREKGLWVVRARDLESGREFVVRARSLVNACGPYADEHNVRTGESTAWRHVFSKGIHIIVRRLTPHRRVLTFFADDGRLFFVIPMGPRTCIGTTDTRVDRPEVQVTEEDRRFVLENINKRLDLDAPLTDADIIAERCGVRPLAISGKNGETRDWLHLSRKHVVEANAPDAHLTIYGGKLTDCLNVGDEVCRAVESFGVALPEPKARWYGEPAGSAREEFRLQARRMDLDRLTAPGASEPLSARLWRRYGAHALAMLEAIRADPRQAEVLVEGTEVARCEVEYAARREMVVSLEDFLRRRTTSSLIVRRAALADAPGLRETCDILFGEEGPRRLDEYFASTPADAAARA